MTEMSAADIKAVTEGNHYGYGYGDMYGGSWIWIILLFALFNGGYGGFGGRYGNGVTQLELQQGFDNQSVMRKLDGITNGLCDGFYSVATNSLQAQNQLQRDLCTGFAAVNAGISENRFAAQQCCCETQRAIDSVKYGASQNTCDIITAIHAEGEATRAQMTQNTIQALRDKLNDKDRDIQTRDFQLSQLAQNSYLVNTLNPAPIPAYPVQNPKCCYNPCGCACGAFAD